VVTEPGSGDGSHWARAAQRRVSDPALRAPPLTGEAGGPECPAARRAVAPHVEGLPAAEEADGVVARGHPDLGEPAPVDDVVGRRAALGGGCARGQRGRDDDAGDPMKWSSHRGMVGNRPGHGGDISHNRARRAVVRRDGGNRLGDEERGPRRLQRASRSLSQRTTCGASRRRQARYRNEAGGAASGSPAQAAPARRKQHSSRPAPGLRCSSIRERGHRRSRRSFTRHSGGPRGVATRSCLVVEQLQGGLHAPGEQLIGQVAVGQRPGELQGADHQPEDRERVLPSSPDVCRVQA